jgi:hypothetical protein
VDRGHRMNRRRTKTSGQAPLTSIPKSHKRRCSVKSKTRFVTQHERQPAPPPVARLASRNAKASSRSARPGKSRSPRHRKAFAIRLRGDGVHCKLKQVQRQKDAGRTNERPIVPCDNQEMVSLPRLVLLRLWSPKTSRKTCVLRRSPAGPAQLCKRTQQKNLENDE